MTEVDDKTAPPSIADFITAYTKKATLKAGVVTLAHSGDAVTITVISPYTKVVIRHQQTERKNLTYGGAFRLKSGTEVKTDITHDDNYYTLDDTTPSITITNDNEKTVKEGEDTVFYDFNHYVTLDQAWIGEKKVDVATVTPPEPPTDDKTPYDYTPWIIGLIVLVVAAALIYWFFLRGRTIGGHTFGAPKAVAAAPVTPAVVVVPTAAPAPAPAAPATEVK
jgi:hypothetical protein